MATTIEQALRPLLVTSFIFSIGIYPQEHSKPHLSILSSITVWLVYGGTFYYVVIFFTVKVLFDNKFIEVIVKINVFVTMMSVIVGIYHSKKLRICMKKLAAVDDTLEILGTPKEYREMHMWSKRIIIGWIMCIVILNIFDILWWLNVQEISYWAFIIGPIITYCFHINLFVELLFIIFLWHTGNRFDKVNEHMRYLLVKEEHGLRCTWKKPIIAVHRYTLYTNNYKRVLWTLMHLHLELSRIAREVNFIFGKQMTFQMMFGLIFVTQMCYYLFILTYVKGIPIYAYVDLAVWISSVVIRIYYINYVCEIVSVKANSTNSIIHQLTNNLRYADIRKELYQFSLQTMHNPLKFTGMGFFYFGNEFLRKFCMTVITFLIITIQLKMPVSRFLNTNLLF